MFRSSKFGKFSTVQDLAQFLEQEFARLESELLETQEVELRPVYREPTRPRDGMVVFADGTLWDPGSGRGLYTYDGAWTKVGSGASAGHDSIMRRVRQYL